MKQNLTKKILSSHLFYGKELPNIGEELALKVDQTLTQDATGTLAYLQFENIVSSHKDKSLKTKLSVSYVDHNTLQPTFENSDDHKYLQTVAAKYGLIYSPPGNGICHQLHLENFAKPGEILIGSDSHTPTSSAVGMIAIGVGGLEVACVLAGEPLYIKMPKVVNIILKGKLSEWCSAKDIILFLLKKFTVKGNVNKIFEYTGDGIKHLSVYDRATITNMGTELGVTTSIFPSDEITKDFLSRQGREKDFKLLLPDSGCSYDEQYEFDLSEIEPFVAMPHSPDNVVSVRDVEGLEVDQVCIGSCTNSSLKDMIFLCKIIEGKKVNKNVSVIVNPGSKQILLVLEKLGLLKNLYESGIRVMEPVCGACIGQGQAPVSSGVSVRTFNRNFEGRSGTIDAKVYLSSVEVAVAAAVFGKIVHPKKLGKYPKIVLPKKFFVSKPNFIYPAKKVDREKVEVFYGPNIKPIPKFDTLGKDITVKVVKKFNDNISTDDIIPGGTKILSLRSNIPAISEYIFNRKFPELVNKLKDYKTKYKNLCFVVGENYGQGSSREHAAVVQKFNGIEIIIAKSFARIHKSNLINFGILPLEFIDKTDYEKIFEDDVLEITNLYEQIKKGLIELKVVNRNFFIKLKVDITNREKEVIIAGGRLNFVKEKFK